MSIERFPEHPKNPVIFAANHIFPLLLFPRMYEIDRKYINNKILFVCDAVFSWKLKGMGLNVAEIDASAKYKSIVDPVDKLKVFLVSTVGKSLGAYKNALNRFEIVDRMTEYLKDDRDVFICPAGISRKDAPWKSGVGHVIKNCDIDTIGIGFVYIPKDIRDETKISFTPVIGSLIKFEDNFHPKKIAAILQEEYNLRK